MNIAFFLTPKSEVVWIRARSTLRQAIERMRRNRYTAVPLLDDDGRYVGTLTEGDIMFHLLSVTEPLSAAAESIRVTDIARRMTNEPVRIDAEVEALIALAIDQNFVPVVDDRGILLGIVRRKPIIEHCARQAGMIGEARSFSAAP